MNPTALYVARHVIPAAMALLPLGMDTPNARALLMAIGQQESGFRYRRQQGGPALGYWQFEDGGWSATAGVLRHPKTAEAIQTVLAVLGYSSYAREDIHAAMEHNDVLACCFARLLLYTDARSLPNAAEGPQGWLIYLATWRPGRPHANSWAANFSNGWTVNA